MKKMILSAAVLLGGLLVSVADVGKSTPKGFTDDLDAALASVKGSKRQVVAVFSGSDWCGWCKKLEAEVLSDAAFLSKATNRYALVYIDLPKDKNLLSPAAAERNPQLVEKYKVRGFPTVLVLDANGEVLATTGYQEGGGAKYLKHLKSAVLSDKYLKSPRAELEKILGELQADVQKSVGPGTADADAAKAAVRKLAPLYVPRLQALLEKVKTAKVPKPVARERQMMVRQIETVIRLMELVDKKESLPDAAK